MVDFKDKQNIIKAMLKEQNAVLLAHYYERDEVQEIADCVGDSLALCLQAQTTNADKIVFCGVHFMAESAKILNPDKTVLLPRVDSACLMADGITAASLAEWKKQFPADLPVVTYVNSSAAVKALSDICCTSANAASVVKSLDCKTVLFTPDRNIAAWVQTKVPDKKIIAYDGVCPIHDNLRGADVRALKNAYPDSMVLAHPECRPEVLELADTVASTSGMFKAVEKRPDVKTFILATENGILYLMRKQFPDRKFIIADGVDGQRMVCPYMKHLTLDHILDCLNNPAPHVIDVKPDIASKAFLALKRMMAIPRDQVLH